MGKTLEVNVETTRLKLSAASVKALMRLERYDWILFTSKNAVKYFLQELRERKISFTNSIQIAAVGPITAQTLRQKKIKVDAMPEHSTVKDMVRALGSIRSMRILFPRSRIARNDAIRDMRTLGAKVRVIPLYTTRPLLLSQSQRKTLIAGGYTSILFKSPSGVRGLMGQLTTGSKKKVCLISVSCMGPTTATAARKAGFRHIKDQTL